MEYAAIRWPVRRDLLRFVLYRHMFANCSLHQGVVEKVPKL